MWVTVHCWSHFRHVFQVWSQYAQNIGDLRKPELSAQAVTCLNHLITNALQHVPDVIAYLAQIKNQSVFNFCAIPQASLASRSCVPAVLLWLQGLPCMNNVFSLIVYYRPSAVHTVVP